MVGVDPDTYGAFEVQLISTLFLFFSCTLNYMKNYIFSVSLKFYYNKNDFFYMSSKKKCCNVVN